MNKTTITVEFPSPEAAREGLGRLVGADIALAPQPTAEQAAAAIEKARKPRADAGVPRGPNARTAAAAKDLPQEQEKPQEKLATTATAEAPLTIADARAAMKRINDTKGLGMDGCMKHLNEFGVQKISDLKPESYAMFIKQADEKVAEVGK